MVSKLPSVHATQRTKNNHDIATSLSNQSHRGAFSPTPQDPGKHTASLRGSAHRLIHKHSDLSKTVKSIKAEKEYFESSLLWQWKIKNLIKIFLENVMGILSFNRLFLFVFLAWLAPVHASTPQDTGMCGFIAATNMESLFSEWSCTVGGLTSTDPCVSGSEWPGVICAGGVVTELNCTSLGLTGTLPTSISQFTNLVVLDLGFNELYGSIPSSVSFLYESLSALRLHHNSLSGEVPDSLCDMLVSGSPLTELSFFANAGITCYPTCLSGVVRYRSLLQSGVGCCSATLRPVCVLQLWGVWQPH